MVPATTLPLVGLVQAVRSVVTVRGEGNTLEKVTALELVRATLDLKEKYVSKVLTTLKMQ